MRQPRLAAPAPIYQYDATVISIHDADTVRFSIRLKQVPADWPPQDLGFHFYVEAGWLVLHAPIRLAGLNAAELATPGGQAARAYLCSLLAVGDVVSVRSEVAARQLAADKYGTRWDGIILKGPLNLNQALLAAGYAAKWDGKGKKPVPAWPRPLSPAPLPA